MKRIPDPLRRLCAILIGIVFLVTGLLKLLDPVGTGLIVTEYFKFFHVSFLAPLAKAAGVLLAFVEACTGAALVEGVYRKFSGAVAGVMIVFFTLVTLILLVFNPPMDCGCFGEWVHLTHLQSFLKNLVLLVLALVAFLPLRDSGKTAPRRRCIAFWVVAASLAVAGWYNHRHLPMMDFTDFAPGAELFASLDKDYQAQDGYMASYIYEKDGQRGSFPLDRLPDSTWTFVQVDTILRNGLARSSARPVLSFTDATGAYRDEEAVLGKVMVFSSYSPEKTDWLRVRKQYVAAAEAGFTPMVLVAGTLRTDSIPAGMTVYYADYKTLITLNRANGGAVYINDGEIISKWAPADYPDNLERLAERDPIDATTSFVVHRRIQAQGFLLYLAAALILL